MGNVDRVTWIEGRKLRMMQKPDRSETVSFQYNSNGLRVRKRSSETVDTAYIWRGDKLVYMAIQGQYLHFFYDAQGKPEMFTYRGSKYVYMKNLQGDIMAIPDMNGNVVVEYTYDAWGRILERTGSMADTVGKANPFRYRGYIYDEETGPYYLKSRFIVQYNVASFIETLCWFRVLHYVHLT